MSEFPLLWALFYPHSRVISIPTLGGSHSQGQQGSVHHITLHVSETAAWRLISDRRRISTHRHYTVFKFHDSFFFFLTPAMPHAQLARFKFSHPAQDQGPQQCKCPVVTTRPPENSLNSMILKLELIFFFFFNSEPSSMRDLSSPTRDRTRAPCVGSSES